MAHPAGLEPATLWFEATCSIQLSHGCVGKYKSSYFAQNLQGVLNAFQTLELFHNQVLEPRLCSTIFPAFPTQKRKTLYEEIGYRTAEG